MSGFSYSIFISIIFANAIFVIFLNFQSVFQIDVNLSFETQGPLHVFLHKLTDMQSHAESGDKNV